MFDRQHDSRVRVAAFDWLSSRVAEHGDVLPRTLLAEGFVLDGRRVPLLGPQGIFRPAVLREVPLSITTAPHGPYDDTFGGDLLHYRYRGTDPLHRDNVGLRLAMERRLPLVYFYGLVPGKYVAAWPVFIVVDDPAALTFTVAVDDASHVGLDPGGGLAPLAVHDPAAEDGRRRYITTVVRQRLHQRSFRERVLQAYRSQCSFCRFRHEELLDAAHITPDVHDEGLPVIQNGLALCRLHHGAFDRDFLGVRPDFVVEVRPDLLEEEDGPTLVHSIQSLHGQRILLPTRREDWPSRERLEERFASFRARGRAS